MNNLKRIEELEAKLFNFENDAYVLSLLTKLDELESQLEASEVRYELFMGLVKKALLNGQPISIKSLVHDLGLKLE